MYVLFIHSFSLTEVLGDYRITGSSCLATIRSATIQSYNNAEQMAAVTGSSKLWLLQCLCSHMIKSWVLSSPPAFMTAVCSSTPPSAYLFPISPLLTLQHSVPAAYTFCFCFASRPLLSFSSHCWWGTHLDKAVAVLRPSQQLPIFSAVSASWPHCILLPTTLAASSHQLIFAFCFLQVTRSISSRQLLDLLKTVVRVKVSWDSRGGRWWQQIPIGEKIGECGELKWRQAWHGRRSVWSAPGLIRINPYL